MHSLLSAQPSQAVPSALHVWVPAQPSLAPTHTLHAPTPLLAAGSQRAVGEAQPRSAVLGVFEVFKHARHAPEPLAAAGSRQAPPRPCSPGPCPCPSRCRGRHCTCPRRCWPPGCTSGVVAPQPVSVPVPVAESTQALHAPTPLLAERSQMGAVSAQPESVPYRWPCRRRRCTAPATARRGVAHGRRVGAARVGAVARRRVHAGLARAHAVGGRRVADRRAAPSSPGPARCPQPSPRRPGRCPRHCWPRVAHGRCSRSSPGPRRCRWRCPCRPCTRPRHCHPPGHRPARPPSSPGRSRCWRCPRTSGTRPCRCWPRRRRTAARYSPVSLYRCLHTGVLELVSQNSLLAHSGEHVLVLGVSLQALLTH